MSRISVNFKLTTEQLLGYNLIMLHKSTKSFIDNQQIASQYRPIQNQLQKNKFNISLFSIEQQIHDRFVAYGNFNGI